MFLYGVLGPILGVVTIGVIVIYSKISYIAWMHAKAMSIRAALTTAARNSVENAAQQDQPIRCQNKNSNNELKSQVKLTKTMLLVVGLYIVTNLPLFFVSTFQKIGPNGQKPIKPHDMNVVSNDTDTNVFSNLTNLKTNDTFHISFSGISQPQLSPSVVPGKPKLPPGGPSGTVTFLLLLWTVNTWANPIIYGFRNKDFQKAFSKLTGVKPKVEASQGMGTGTGNSNA